MNERDSFALVMVQKATNYINSCMQHMSNNDHSKARESSLQAKVLLDLIDSVENHPILQQCKRHLGDVIGAVMDPSDTDATCSTNSQDFSTHFTSLDTDTNTNSSRSQQQESSVGLHRSVPPTCSPTQHESAMEPTIRFADIVGHEAAKDALYENVVLPMLMPEHMKRQVYCGIRANLGNVLLFGVPGTGKTILARKCSDVNV